MSVGGTGDRGGRRRVVPPTVGQVGKAGSAVVPTALVVVAQVVLFPMPVGVWVQGLVLGLLGALMAVGLGLVYRLNRVVNFAQGDLGSAPAVLAFGLVGLSGVNYFLGLATGLVAVVVLTTAVEILVVRRFNRSPRLMLTVATIGLSQALIVLSLLIPNLWGQTPIGTASVHFPWHLSLGLSPIVFTADDLVGAVVGVAGLAAVALWFRFARPRDRHPGHRRPALTGPPCSASRSTGCRRSPGWWPGCCPTSASSWRRPSWACPSTPSSA